MTSHCSYVVCIMTMCVCVGVHVCVCGAISYSLFLSSKVRSTVEIDLIVYLNVADESLTAMCTQLMYNNYSFNLLCDTIAKV